jgi:hypothetical protein
MYLLTQDTTFFAAEGPRLSTSIPNPNTGTSLVSRQVEFQLTRIVYGLDMYLLLDGNVRARCLIIMTVANILISYYATVSPYCAKNSCG